jgi:hypothetical protein
VLPGSFRIVISFDIILGLLPPGLELEVVPYNAQWPGGSMLYPGIDYASSLSSLFNFQFQLNAGDWEFHFIFEKGAPLVYKETCTANASRVLRLFAARVPVFGSVWLLGIVVNGTGISLTQESRDSDLSHFLIYGSVNQENPKQNLDLVCYSVLSPSVVVPNVFS